MWSHVEKFLLVLAVVSTPACLKDIPPPPSGEGNDDAGVASSEQGQGSPARSQVSPAGGQGSPVGSQEKRDAASPSTDGTASLPTPPDALAVSAPDSASTRSADAARADGGSTGGSSAGKCVDTSTDKMNCGACGHICDVGACGGGKCLCTNGVRDGNETAVDCGGSCKPCDPPAARCGAASVCAQGLACVAGRCLSNNGLVAFYDLDQPPPAIRDASGNQNNGTLQGGAQVPGQLGQGYRFDGTGCIRVPDSDSLAMTGHNSLTAMAWVNPRVNCVGDRVMAFNKEQAFEVAVLCGSGVVQAAVQTDTGPWVWMGTGTISSGAWHHLALTWDGLTVRLYLDGRQSDERPLSGILAPPPAGLGIGCRHVAPNGTPGPDAPLYLDGTIDEMAVYSRALTPQEIADYVVSTR